MIWLKNSTGVIGSNSPRAISGARHRSTASARREFSARWALRHALFRAEGLANRREDGAVIALQDFQEQGAGQFLLRPEEMEKAAIGRPRPGSNGGNGSALNAVAVEHRQSRRQQILARRGRHSRPRMQ
jgi:hypothetical protein